MTDQLARFRVVEVGDGVSICWCGLQFARYGAEVVRLEPPSGHRVRGMQPSPWLWEHLSRGVSVASDDDRADRLRSADFVLTDRPLAEAEELAAAGVVVAELTDFSADGPYASFQATDLVYQAISGYMSVNGEADRPPLRAPANTIGFAVGSQLFVGALAALREREATGVARVVRVSALEAVASLVQYTFTEYFGLPSERKGGAGPPMLPCRDGWLFFEYRFAATRGPLLQTFDLTEDDLPEGEDALAAFVADRAREWCAKDLFVAMSRRGAVTAFVQTPRDLLDDEHLRARGFLEARRTGSAGPAAHPHGAVARPPIRTIGRGERAPAQTKARGRSRSGAGPLAGVRVADFTQAWLGPYATMLLADLGADVIKIESRSRPDVWRVLSQVPPCARRRAHKWNVSHLTNSVSRNKRSLTLDLSSERGIELALELVATADIVAENYTPRVMERFGLGYERMREVNPSLVMLSFSGYGRDGPYADFKANGATIETIAGWVSLFGYGDERPLNLGDYPVDPVAGLQMAAAAIMGLIDAEMTGRGAWFESSMIEIAVDHIADELMLSAADPSATAPIGNRHRDMVPHGVFPCSDGWVAVSVRDDADWEAVSSAVGIDRFGAREERRAAEDEIDEAISAWTRERPAAEAMRVLQEAGVPSGVVNDTLQAMDDPHLGRWFRSIDHVDVGARRYHGFGWSFSGLELVAQRPPPRLGEHNEEVLGELGLSAEDIARLEADGISRSVLSYEPRTAPAKG